MKKIFASIVYVCISLIIICLSFSCCSPTEAIDELLPGKRDYQWSADSITRPGFPYISSMWGSSTKDIWGAGFSEDVNDCLWHYDGISWKRATQGTPITEWGQGSEIVGGVWGTAQNDVWAFGGRRFSNPERTEPFVMHYNGQKWTEVIGDKNNMSDGLFDIYGVRKNEFWIAGFEYIYHYKDNVWKKYYIGANKVAQRIARNGNNIFFTNYEIGEEKLYLSKFNGQSIIAIDSTALLGEGKFGVSDLIFTQNTVYSLSGYGIHKAELNDSEINTNTWNKIISTFNGSLVRSIKITEKDIIAVGSYFSPYHFNGENWQPIPITCLTTNEHRFIGVWGDGKEIFICDVENGIIYHGK